MEKMLKKRRYFISVSLVIFLLAMGVSVTSVVASPTRFLEKKVISGSITDASSGEPLAGATVIAQGSAIGTAADANGVYSIEVSDETTILVFSYIGYETIEVEIGERTAIDVQMYLASASLNEVVVVGYGTQRRADLTGAIGSVSQEEFNGGVIVSPEQLIQGKIAGVSITANNGEPGAAQTIIIRGPNSLRTGNTPLFVVDGVPIDDDNISPSRANVGFGGSEPLNPLNFINPADIESIDVLKDASAAAIYGTRGANGVIIITTKKGKGQSGLQYNNYFGVSAPANTINVLSAQEFISFQESKGDPANILDRNLNTDWQGEIFRNDAFTQNHSLSLNGGSDNSTFYVSLSYLDQEGLILTNDLKRLTGRINFSQRLIDDRLKVNLNFTASNTDNRSAPRNDGADANFGSLIPDALGGNPTYPVRNADGSLFIFPNGRNPLADIDLYTSLTRNDRVLGNIEASFEILKGLEYKINFALDRSVGNGDVQSRPSGLANIAVPEGIAVFSKTEANNSLIENYLQYRFAIGSHDITALAGHSFQRFSNRFTQASISGFTTEEIELYLAPQTGTLPTIPSGNATINKLQSYFGRVNYTYDDKYLLTATIRADGSSKFGSNNQYGYFPSIAAAWKISEEGFLKGSSVINELKLRAGWGQTGNQEIPGKITQASLSSSIERGSGYPLSGDEVNNPGFTFSRTANPDIQWEVTSQTNIGLDFSLFGGSFFGSVDYFYKNTTDVLLELTVTDPISPTSTFWSNLDMDIVNQGIELSFNYASNRNKPFYWELGANATVLDNEVQNAPFSFLRTGDVDGPGLSGVTVAGNLNGEAIGTFFLLEHLGFDEAGVNIFNDINKDGVINADDRIIAGAPIPNFTYNFYANFGFKGLSLGLNFNGVTGNKIYNNTANAYFNSPQLSSGTNIATEYLVDNEDATNSATESTRYLEDGGFLRLNNTTLRYDFGTSKIGWLRGLAVYVTGQNIFTITDYSGFDPEVNVPSSVGGIVGYGIDFANYPRARTFLAGVDIKF